MRVGQKLKKNGTLYTIYKIDSFGRCFAEDEFKIDIICVPNLVRVK